MRNRIVLSCLLAFLLGMCLCGCTIAGKDSKCTLTVVTYYSGWGIDGQDLGSGTFVDTFTVSDGDEFYEWYNGHWHEENQKNDNAEIVLSVKKVNEDSVTVQINGQEKVLKYDTIEKVNSTFVVFDGTNFCHSICFTK